MDNFELNDIINQKTDNKYEFKLKSATLSKQSNCCFVEMFYKDGTILSLEDRMLCEEAMRNVLPQGFTYEFKFVKNFIVNEVVKSTLEEFFKKNFPSIVFTVEKVDCEEKNKEIILNITDRVYEYVLDRNIENSAEDFLENNFSTFIDVKFNLVSDNIQNDITEDKIEIDVNDFVDSTIPERFIKVSSVTPLIGSLTDNAAFYIKDKTKADEEVTFCGKIVFINEYTYTPKKKEDKSENKEKQSKNVSLNAEENETVVNQRTYFKFSLEDFTGKISCVFFANKQNIEQMKTLQSKESVIVSGKLEQDKFSDGLTLRVKNISRCELPENFEEEIVFKDEPINYTYVFPEKLEYYAQADFFSNEEKVTDKFVLENSFVVFDFETTGFEYLNGAKIIEIGAVKVENGKFTDKFMCFVDPQVKIPSQITDLTGITDEDVKGANTYDQVLKDFYKFTRGCYLVGYNVNFDYGFLNYYGKKCGYNFDNKLLDVYKLAQKGVYGVKNYKLGTIAEKLGVALDNAHRAVFDAIATAEVFLKLTDFIDKSKV